MTILSSNRATNDRDDKRAKNGGGNGWTKWQRPYLPIIRSHICSTQSFHVRRRTIHFEFYLRHSAKYHGNILRLLPVRASSYDFRDTHSKCLNDYLNVDFGFFFVLFRRIQSIVIFAWIFNEKSRDSFFLLVPFRVFCSPVFFFHKTTNFR